MVRGISKGLILWFVLTMITVFFSMASIITETSMRYIYFIFAIGSSYIIKITSGNKGDAKDAKR